MLGLGTITKKVFGTPNDRKVKSVRPLVAKINALEPEYQALDDAGLVAKTTEFRERIAKGETLDDILPEASPMPAKAPAGPWGCVRSIRS